MVSLVVVCLFVVVWWRHNNNNKNDMMMMAFIIFLRGGWLRLQLPNSSAEYKYPKLYCTNCHCAF